MRMDCGQMGALWGGVWCSGQTGAAAAGTERSIAFTSAAGAGRLTQWTHRGFRSVPAVGPMSACSHIAVWAGHEMTGCNHMLWAQGLCEGRGSSERQESDFSCR